MVGRGGSGVLVGAAVGMLFLIPAHGLAQDSCMDYGAGSPVDPLTLAILKICAERGSVSAQFYLGAIYATGDGVPEDDAEAVRWLRLAAEQGHSTAQSNLGVMYGAGDGIPEDDVEAVRWYRLAAEQGDSAGQLNLGIMYGNGEGVARDDVLAYMWWNLSAAQGDDQAAVHGSGTRSGVGHSIDLWVSL